MASQRRRDTAATSKTAPHYNRNGSVLALRIDGKKVTKVNEVEVGTLPEGVAFSRDGRYVYVGNFLDQTLSVLRWEGAALVNAGTTLRLPGHPGSMR